MCLNYDVIKYFIFRFNILYIIISILCLLSTVEAQDKINIPIRLTELTPLAEESNLPPLFEYGVFVGSVYLADYPAADQSRLRTIPAPLIRYHGELFRADDENGTRFRFIKNTDLDLDLSFGGSFPTETGNNDARIGMPNLDFTGEIGPRLTYYFYRNKHAGQVRIGLPLRGSFATNFKKWYGVGYVFAPVFQAYKFNLLIDNLDLFFSHALNYLDEGQADYFFQVNSEYQTSERSIYDAHAGFLGSSTSVALKYMWKNKMLLLATSYSDYTTSVNTSSYLHRQNINWTYFIGLGWTFSESEARGVR